MTLEALPEWSQFGLAGLIVAAMFWLLWNVIKSSMERFDTVMKEHREERSEWRKSSESRDDKLERTLSEVTRALHQNSPK